MSMRESNHAIDRLRGEGCLASPEATGRRGPVTAARDGVPAHVALFDD